MPTTIKAELTTSDQKSMVAESFEVTDTVRATCNVSKSLGGCGLAEIVIETPDNVTRKAKVVVECTKGVCGLFEDELQVALDDLDTASSSDYDFGNVLFIEESQEKTDE